MKKTLQGFIWLLSKIIGRKNLENILIYSAKSIGVNLHLHGLIQIGGWSNNNSEINGEILFLKSTLPGLISTDVDSVFFDVGANVGDYSLALRTYYPKVQIHSFEPVKPTFNKLAENTSGTNIKLHNIGLSDKTGVGLLYNTIGDTDNEIASAYKDIFKEVFKKDNQIESIEFEMDTIDDFCKKSNIKNIDFLKIDVEGHELSVLSGATEMLLNKQIKVIQFEFNAHNVYSKVFLRDFYLLLIDFDFYRITANGIIKLGPYSSYNEIFLLQNILAVRNDICNLINPAALSQFSNNRA